MPKVVGVRLPGELPKGATATDLVLVVTELLRASRRRRRVRRVRRGRPRRPVARGPGDDLQHVPGVRGHRDPLPDRRRDARLPAPDRSLARAGRARGALRARMQGLWREPGDGPTFDERLTLDLATRRAARGGAAPAAGPRAAGPVARQLPDELPRRARGRRRGRRGRGRPRCVRGRRGLGRVVPGVRSARVRVGRSEPAPAGPARRTGPRRCASGRPPNLPGRAGRDRRRAGRRPDRVRGDRRDHQLHQHLQPDGHGRSRAARPQCRRARAARRPDREDLARPGIEAR